VEGFFMRKRTAAAIALAGLVVGALVGLYLALPTLAEGLAHRAIAKAARGLAAKVSWEGFVFHRYDRIELYGFRLHRPDAAPGEAPLLSTQHIDIEVDPTSVFGGKVRLRSVAIEGPSVHLVTFPDGSTNYAEVLSRLRRILQSRGGGGEESADSPFRYIARQLPKLELRGGRVTWDDRRGDNLLSTYGPIEVTGGQLSVRDESPVQEALDLRFDGQAQLALVDNGVRFSGRFTYPGKALTLQTGLIRPLTWPVAERTLSVGGVELTSEGQLQLTQIALSHPGAPLQGAPVAATAAAVEIEVEGGVLRSQPGGVDGLLKRVQRVRVVEPKLFVQRYANRTTNFQDLVDWAKDLLPPPANGPAAVSPGGAAPLPPLPEPQPAEPDNQVQAKLVRWLTRLERAAVTVAQLAYRGGAALPIPEVVVENGTVRYADDVLLQKGFQGKLQNFNLTARKLEGEPIVEYAATFDTENTRTERAGNSINGRVHLHTRDIQVGVRVDQLELAPYRALAPSITPIDAGTVLHQTQLNLVWSHAHQSARVEGNVSVRGFPLAHAALAEKTCHFPDLGFDVSATLDARAHRLTFDKLTVRLGAAKAQVNGVIEELTTAPEFALEVAVPETPCQAIFNGLAPELVPALEGMRIDGTLSWSLSLRADSRKWEAIRYEAATPKLTGVRVTDLGKHVRMSKLRGPFMHRVEEPDGSLVEFTTGPGASGFVPYPSISALMTEVITTTEDSRFFRHSGFSPNAIFDSIVANLTKGKFVRGASTITQQLAKNLFLTRQKTLSRKLQEAILAWQLEQNLSKTDILELYFNVIEFGPGIYGIGRASHHYFRKHASELDLLECIFLASLIPSPKRYYAQYLRGEVSEGWAQRLQFIGNAMLERGKISQEEFDALQDFSPRFWNSPKRPDSATPPPEGAPQDGLGAEGAEDGQEQPPVDFDDSRNDPGGDTDDDEQGEPGILFDPAQHP
jgi:hypothetical protein